jgi:hypothetical protein
MGVAADIRPLSPTERLEQILSEGRIRASVTFRTRGRQVVAFTESTQASVRRLIRDRRYMPYGVGFTKQFVFDQGGAPVLYVRGDEWADADDLPDPLRARIVLYWPGAVWEPGDPVLFEGAEALVDPLDVESQWLHEREWRAPNDVTFGWSDVSFLVTPSPGWLADQVEHVRLAYGDEYAEYFEAIPVVAINTDGTVLRDDTGIWQGDA